MLCAILISGVISGFYHCDDVRRHHHHHQEPAYARVESLTSTESITKHLQEGTLDLGACARSTNLEHNVKNFYDKFDFICNRQNSDTGPVGH